MSKNAPTDQANKWLKCVEKVNGLRVVRNTDENYMDILAEAISAGTSVLMENIRKICSIISFLLRFGNSVQN